jgi:hypothetical protein
LHGYWSVSNKQYIRRKFGPMSRKQNDTEIKEILGSEAANNNLKMCRVFLAYGNAVYIVMIYNRKFNTLQRQFLQFAVYFYLNIAHFIIYIFTCFIFGDLYSPEYIILKHGHTIRPHITVPYGSTTWSVIQ